MRRFPVILTLLLLLASLHAQSPENREKRHDVLTTNLIAGGVIVGWGLLQWDYGDRSMHASSEGWFGSGTKNGGADKLGHFYTSYAASRGFSSLYRSYGYAQHDAAMYGAFSSLFVTSLMEVGDAFSDYGFSHEDMIMNLGGALGGYLLETDPRIDRMIDVRLEYIPSEAVRNGESTDIVTDYDGMKFLLALKFEAFETFRDSPMRYIELQTGYYTRHNGTPDLERYSYVAVGLNLSALFNSDNRYLNGLFECYQIPCTYLPAEHRY